MPTSLSPDQISHALAIAQSGNGQAAVLDPTDPDQRDLIFSFLEAAGKSGDRYPALHGAVARGAPSNGGQIDATVVDLGRDRSGRATSRTWVSSRGGAYISGAHTLVLDSESNRVLASGTATQVGGNLVQASTRTAEAEEAAPRMTALTFYHSQPSPDAEPGFGLVSASMSTAADDEEPDVHLTAPVQTRSTGEYIVIALCRDPEHENGDADYVYPSSANVNPDRLVVPFVGTASLPYEVDTTQQPTLTTKLYVSAASAWAYPYTGFDLAGPVSMSGYDVTWNYPFDDQPINLTASIQYNVNTAANDTVTDFFYQFAIPVQNPIAPVYTFTVCSKDTPDEPSLNCHTIEDLQYWWHCVLAGTPITLADGATIPVEEVDNSMRVRTGSGGVAAVEATSRGMHTAAQGPLCRLTTSGGSSVVVSSRHPVLTMTGLVPAEDVAVGSEILTERGGEAVTANEALPHEGQVINLKLATDGEPGTFLAGGIAVGDHVALAVQERNLRHDPGYVLPRLPESHHQDWMSALTDATA